MRDISFLTTFLLFFGNSYGYCSWNINKDLPSTSPIFLTESKGNYELYYPNSTNIVLNKYQRLVAVCNGFRNYVALDAGRNISVNLVCESGKTVKVGSKLRNITDVKCAKDVSSDIKRTNRSCNRTTAKTLSIGFNTTHGWMELFTVCFDFSKSTTLYATHTLHGKAQNGSYVGNDRPDFKSTGLPTNVSWATIYKKTMQTDRLIELLGHESGRSHSKISMDRGHLAPDNDFIFKSMQLATYFYANAVPQWSTINRGNWVRVENGVRRLAKYMKEDLTIITGTYGVLQYRNDSNRYTNIYLAARKNVPVPEYIWKIVCTVENRCISLISRNDPFETKENLLCNDICQITRWDRIFNISVSKGVITCCDVRDLSNTIKYIPIKNVRGILNYPL